VEGGEDRGTQRFDPARDALDRLRAREIDDRAAFSGRIQQPALADAVLPIPLKFFAAVVGARSRRQHLGRENGCAPDLSADDRQSLGRHEEDVRLHDEIAVSIEDDVDGRDCY
jgi:hypothetical protein